MKTPLEQAENLYFAIFQARYLAYFGDDDELIGGNKMAAMRAQGEALTAVRQLYPQFNQPKWPGTL